MLPYLLVLLFISKSFAAGNEGSDLEQFSKAIENGDSIQKFLGPVKQFKNNSNSKSIDILIGMNLLNRDIKDVSETLSRDIISDRLLDQQLNTLKTEYNEFTENMNSMDKILLELSNWIEKRVELFIYEKPKTFLKEVEDMIKDALKSTKDLFSEIEPHVKELKELMKIKPGDETRHEKLKKNIDKLSELTTKIVGEKAIPTYTDMITLFLNRGLSNIDFPVEEDDEETKKGMKEVDEIIYSKELEDKVLAIIANSKIILKKLKEMKNYVIVAPLYELVPPKLEPLTKEIKKFQEDAQFCYEKTKKVFDFYHSYGKDFTEFQNHLQTIKKEIDQIKNANEKLENILTNKITNENVEELEPTIDDLISVVKLQDIPKRMSMCFKFILIH